MNASVFFYDVRNYSIEDARPIKNDVRSENRRDSSDDWVLFDVDEFTHLVKGKAVQ